MTIFARRSIQRFLSDLDSILTPPQLAPLIDRLNKGNLDSLAVEWEVCVLFALMNLGRVAYEPTFAGKSHPDIHFTARDKEDLQFIADVTLISDSHLEENNPFTALTQIVAEKARKLGIPGTFSFSAEHHGEIRRVQGTALDTAQNKFARVRYKIYNASTSDHRDSSEPARGDQHCR
jgi:hypothetical protein